MRQDIDAAEPEEGELKEIKTNLQNAEQRHRRLIEKRNQLNDRARELREERDEINARKRNLVQEMRRLQKIRDENNATAREHREKRNEFQRQAKSLIDAKRRMSGSDSRGYGGKVRELETEIRLIEHRQQTEAMSVQKENELLDKLKAKSKELEEAKTKYSEETKLLEDVKDINQKIDELFALADEEHKKTVEASDAAQKSHEAIKPVLDQLRFLDEESDKKHNKAVAAREEANAAHEEATKMREEVLGLRGKRRDIFQERRALITDHKEDVRRNLLDPTKLDEKADEAVSALLKKGKISLGPR